MPGKKFSTVLLRDGSEVIEMYVVALRPTVLELNKDDPALLKELGQHLLHETPMSEKLMTYLEEKNIYIGGQMHQETMKILKNFFYEKNEEIRVRDAVDMDRLNRRLRS